MDTQTINNPGMIKPPVIGVPVKHMISNIMMNKIYKDLNSKIEMILRDCSSPELNVNFSSAHRKHKARFYVDIKSALKEELIAKYTEHITKTDNTLSQLRDSLKNIERQYASYLKNFGLTYSPPSYRNPFEDINVMFRESGFGDILSKEKIKTLLNTIVGIAESMLSHYSNTLTVLSARTRELNTSEPNMKKKRRVALLQERAETYLNELLALRDTLKETARNEYEKLKNEKLDVERHEDHGPVPIL